MKPGGKRAGRSQIEFSDRLLDVGLGVLIQTFLSACLAPSARGKKGIGYPNQNRLTLGYPTNTIFNMEHNDDIVQRELQYMPKPKKNVEREERIENEIIVDAHDSDE